MKLKKTDAVNPFDAILQNDTCKTREDQCNLFTIPLKSFDDFSKLYWQAEFDEEPTLIAELLLGCDNSIIPVNPIDYNLYQAPNGKWVYNWQGIQPLANYPAECYTVAVIAYFASTQPIIYVGERYCVTDCEDVSYIETCYNISANDNIDANGIYYGYPTGPTIGSISLVYRHVLSVRNLSVKNNGLRTIVSKTNKRPINTSIERYSNINIEDQIPYYYAKYLQVLFSNGSIIIGNNTYVLDEVTFDLISKCCETFHISASIKDEISNALGCVDCISSDLFIPPNNCVDSFSGVVVTAFVPGNPLALFIYATPGGSPQYFEVYKNALLVNSGIANPFAVDNTNISNITVKTWTLCGYYPNGQKILSFPNTNIFP